MIELASVPGVIDDPQRASDRRLRGVPAFVSLD
jgi:hypothetical protein